MVNQTIPNTWPWPEWSIQRVLGKGSYGTVYHAKKWEHNVSDEAAIKVISIPQSQAEVESLRNEGLNMDSTRTFFQQVVDGFVEEIRVMQRFKGVQNIVSVEDFRVVEKPNEVGWDIYIRMELLTPFQEYVRTNGINEQMVMKLGKDMCTALELCEREHIIHRDIKPENIFINQFGNFKLGDFGIARRLDNTTGGMSQKGTLNYMAPEVAAGPNYDGRADIYSLGIVLYKLLNGNRLPFLDTDQQAASPMERKRALERRLRGEPLPLPACSKGELAQLVLCACQFDPERRFATASAMKAALNQLERGGTRQVRPPVPVWDDRTQEEPIPEKNKDNTAMVVILGVLGVLIVAVAAALILYLNWPKDRPSEPSELDSVVEEVSQEETAAPSEEPSPEVSVSTGDEGGDVLLPDPEPEETHYADSDVDVVLVQNCMIRLGHDEIIASGVYDDATVKAVKEYQEYWGMAVTGNASKRFETEIYNQVQQERYLTTCSTVTKVDPSLYPQPEVEIYYDAEVPFEGEEIKYIQAAMVKLNAGALQINGIYNEATRDAVMVFQGWRNFEKNGIVNKTLLGSIENALIVLPQVSSSPAPSTPAPSTPTPSTPTPSVPTPTPEMSNTKRHAPASHVEAGYTMGTIPSNVSIPNYSSGDVLEYCTDYGGFIASLLQYDSQNRKIGAIGVGTDGFSPWGVINYRWDDQMDSCYYYEDAAKTILRSYVICFYDENDNLEEILAFDANDNLIESSSFYRGEYELDENGLLSCVTMYRYDGERYYTQYLETGYVVSEVRYKGDGTVTEYREYYYLANGRESRIVFFDKNHNYDYTDYYIEG